MCVTHYKQWWKKCDPKVLIKPTDQHGLSRTPEYCAWNSMIQRCNNKENKLYPHYGARGIKICVEWENSFLTFYSDMGKRTSKIHTLERIDNNGNYTPKNCRWATNSEQNKNRRDTNFITAFGKTMCLHDWSELTGVHESTIRDGIFNGKLSPEEVLTKKYIKKGGVKIKKWDAGSYGLLTMKEMVELSGLSRGTIFQRIQYRGWTPKESVETPLREYPKRLLYRGAKD
jgi:hypothetical protein